jgi:hypothetical protein
MNKLILSLLAVAFAVDARAAEINLEAAIVAKAVRVVGHETIVTLGVPSLTMLASLDLDAVENAARFSDMASATYARERIVEQLASRQPDKEKIAEHLARMARSADHEAAQKADALIKGYAGGTFSGPTLAAAEALSEKLLESPHVEERVKKELREFRAADHAKRLAAALEPERRDAHLVAAEESLRSANSGEKIVHSDLRDVADAYRRELQFALKADSRDATGKALPDALNRLRKGEGRVPMYQLERLAARIRPSYDFARASRPHFAYLAGIAASMATLTGFAARNGVAIGLAVLMGASAALMLFLRYSAGLVAERNGQALRAVAELRDEKGVLEEIEVKP